MSIVAFKLTTIHYRVDICHSFSCLHLQHTDYHTPDLYIGYSTLLFRYLTFTPYNTYNIQTVILQPCTLDTVN